MGAAFRLHATPPKAPPHRSKRHRGRGVGRPPPSEAVGQTLGLGRHSDPDPLGPHAGRTVAMMGTTVAMGGITLGRTVAMRGRTVAIDALAKWGGGADTLATPRASNSDRNPRATHAVRV